MFCEWYNANEVLMKYFAEYFVFNDSVLFYLIQIQVVNDEKRCSVKGTIAVVICM